MSKYSDLLKRATPLPWHENTPFAHTGASYWADQKLRHHSANVLPKALEVLQENKRLFEMMAEHFSAPEDIAAIESLQALIPLIEEVKD